jgi:hypothetical protein
MMPSYTPLREVKSSSGEREITRTVCPSYREEGSEKKKKPPNAQQRKTFRRRRTKWRPRKPLPPVTTYVFFFTIFLHNHIKPQPLSFLFRIIYYDIRKIIHFYLYFLKIGHFPIENGL